MSSSKSSVPIRADFMYIEVPSNLTEIIERSVQFLQRF